MPKDGAEELRLLYQMNGEALEKAKDRQWLVARYSILLLAAVAAISKWTDSSDTAQFGLIVATLLIPVAGTVLLLLTQRALQQHRKIGWDIREQFPVDAQAALTSTTAKEKHIGFCYEPAFLISFVVLLWIGAIVVIYGVPLTAQR